jgi:hypothetical protein
MFFWQPSTAAAKCRVLSIPRKTWGTVPSGQRNMADLWGEHDGP